MPISYKYNKITNLIEAKVTGILCSGEIENYFIDLNNERDLLPGFIEIVDFNEAEDLVLKYTDLSRLSEIFKAITNKGHRITLFAAYNTHAQGMLGMMMPLFHTMKINVLVCKSKNELELNMNILNNND